MLDLCPSLQRLVTELSKFPGIGRKTATRLAFYVLGQSRQDVSALAEALMAVKDQVGYCSVCFNMTETDPCPICADEQRNPHSLCVVEQVQDLLAVERSRSFHGRYHVLHGALSPLDGVGPESLRLPELGQRLEQEQIEELVVATNFNMEGEATALYIHKLAKPLHIRVTRLAYGIPLGSDLEYVDETTVHRAVEGRREM